MERYEMAELLSKKAGVSLEEARTALEENHWDLLDAMVALERAHKTSGPAVDMKTGPAGDSGVRPVRNVSGRQDHKVLADGFSALWGYVKKLLRITLDNDFVVFHQDKQIITVPVLVLIVLLFASVGLLLVALITGLFLGCRYQFTGRQLGRDSINDAMGKMSDLADGIKESLHDEDEHS